MQISKKVSNEKEIDYYTLKKIQEHAKEYNNVSDKKEFLRNVGAYEQKFILLNSSRPCDVLFNLDSLQLPTTKKMLDELTFDELTSILALFTSEDKERLYNKFSNLEFVNRFIVHDKNAVEHLEDLEVDRKVELLNSSDSKTVVASSKVYESVSDEMRDKVVQSVSTTDGLNALSNAESFNESNSSTANEDREVEAENKQVEEKQAEEKQGINEEEKEQKEEKEEKEENDISYEEKVEFFKENLEHYKEKFPEIEKIDINDPKFFALLAADLVSLVEADLRAAKDRKEEKQKEDDKGQDSVEKFKQVQAKCEKELVQELEVHNSLQQSVSQIDVNSQDVLVNNEADIVKKTI